MSRQILRNSAHCLKCGEEIESTHRHDFHYCSCGNIAVDGGRDYLRRVGNIGGGTWEDTSVYAEEAS